jgi:hypothetical protein
MNSAMGLSLGGAGPPQDGESYAQGPDEAASSCRNTEGVAAAGYVVTRRSLHAIAEQVLAGPQHRATGEIALRVTADGFTTVAQPVLSVTSTHLSAVQGRFPLDGATCRGLASLVGVDVGAPLDLYTEHSDIGIDEVLVVDPTAAGELLGALWRGTQALQRLDPAETPILWPEHFDVGISSAEVNYGVSPGDGYLDEPYAYVGPWTKRSGPFWNAPFGAARPMRELGGEDLYQFLAEGRRLTGASLAN